MIKRSMTKNQKISLVVLAVLAIFYLLAVALGFKQSSSHSKEDPTQPDWAAGLSSVMSAFAPRIKLSKLTCNNQPVADYFVLSEQKPSCEIKLDSGLTQDKDFWKTDLVLASANTVKPEVYFYAKYPEKNKATDAEPDKDCLKIVPEKVPSDFWLAIELTPKNSRPAKTKCWLKSDSSNIIGLTVTGPSTHTNLTLSCHGCTQENKKKIQLRFKP